MDRKTPRTWCMPRAPSANGTLTVTREVSRYTKAKLFSEIGKRTECFWRLSTVAGERGTGDAEPEVCGFAMKWS
jgi:catalase